jgi:lipopolysaccharide transport system permease protein
MAKNKSRVVVYRAGSPLRDPLEMLRELASDISAGRELAWRLFVRNISARYRQTLLGYFWAIFPPLATTAIWLFLTREQVVKIAVNDVPYPVFLVTGTILWQTFVDAIQIPVRIVSESKSMLAKINFPRESLPMTAFAECWFNVGIRLLVLAVAYIYMGFVPAETVMLAFLGLFSMIMLGIVIGLFLSPFALLYQDVGNGLVLITQFWMYITPVIYAAKNEGVMGLINKYNPISPLLTQTRDWILTGGSHSLGAATIVFFLTIIFSAFVLVLYRVALPRAIERISS